MMNESKQLVVEGKMKVLRDKWQEEYGYTCYFTRLDKRKQDDRKEGEWEKIQGICQEISEMHWEDDVEELKRYQAEAFCKLGMLHMERGELDNACELLDTAKNMMEDFSLQYVLPRHYIWTYMYMARAYTEKHREQKYVEQYCVKAGEILKRILKEDKKEPDIAQTIDVSKYYDIPSKDFSAITSQLKTELMLQWVIIKSNMYKQDRDKDFIKEASKIKEYLYTVRQEIRKFEEKIEREEKEHTDDAWIEFWVKKQLDTYWASKGVYYKWLYFVYRDNVDLPNSKCERDECFAVAVESFVEGVRADAKNTICFGNIAALLYNYQTEILDSSEHAENSDFLQELMHKMQKKIEIVKEPEIEDGPKKIRMYIDLFLEEVFRVDPNNMFALNLKALSERDSKKDESYPYLALRQLSLRKRFMEMDRQLPAKEEKEKKEADHVDALREIKVQIINLHAAVAEYMNKAIYPREKFKGLIVGHYTKASVLPKLLGWRGNSYLRIRNVKHLNDPSEGALFMGYINQWRDNEAQRVKETASVGNGRDLISNLLQIYEYKRREEWNQKSSAYMGCFTSRIDQLNMWSQYGDAGKGCCLCIDAASFDKGTAVPLAEVSTEEYMYRYKMEDNQYPLYMVVYLLGNTEIDLETVEKYANKRNEAEVEKLHGLQKTIKEKTGVWDGKTEEKFKKEEKNVWRRRTGGSSRHIW